MQEIHRNRMILWQMALFETERLIQLDLKLRNLPDVDKRILQYLSLGELKDAAGACLDMAVIEFCTMYTSGYGDSWISKNTAGEIDQLRDEIERKAFPEDHERHRYLDLKDQLKRIRDNLIAHRSGKSIGSEQHENGRTTYTEASKTWKIGIDRLPEFVVSTKQLRNAIHALLNDTES